MFKRDSSFCTPGPVQGWWRLMGYIEDVRDDSPVNDEVRTAKEP